MAEVTEYGIKEEKSGQLSLILEPVDETNDEFTEPSEEKKVEFNTQQQVVFDKLMNSKNHVFLTGSGGTGKSFVLNEYMRQTPDVDRLICAPTGIAACNVGGLTIHSTFGLGFDKDRGIHYDIERAKYGAASDKLNFIADFDEIIIDEISMVSAPNFDFVNKSLENANRIRQQRGKEPIRVILCGDFLQIPPVVKAKQRDVAKDTYGDEHAFSFLTKSWENLDFEVFNLYEVKRASDPDFVRNVNKLRKGDTSCFEYFDQEQFKIDRSVIQNGSDEEFEGIIVTSLRRYDPSSSDEINKHYINSLPGIAIDAIPDYTYDMEMSSEDRDNNNNRTKIKAFQDEFKFMIKPEARIMFNRNDPNKRFYNGSFGIFKGFERNGYSEYAKIELCDAKGKPIGKIIDVEQISEDIKGVKSYTYFDNDGNRKTGRHMGVIATGRRYPFQIGKAISIHKSQGQTFPHMCLYPSNIFDDGQLYVALSRATGPDAIRIVEDLNNADGEHLSINSILTNSSVLDMYGNNFGKESHLPYDIDENGNEIHVMDKNIVSVEFDEIGKCTLNSVKDDALLPNLTSVDLKQFGGRTCDKKKVNEICKRNILESSSLNFDNIMDIGSPLLLREQDVYDTEGHHAHNKMLYTKVDPRMPIIAEITITRYDKDACESLKDGEAAYGDRIDIKFHNISKTIKVDGKPKYVGASKVNKRMFCGRPMVADFDEFKTARVENETYTFASDIDDVKGTRNMPIQGWVRYLKQCMYLSDQYKTYKAQQQNITEQKEEIVIASDGTEQKRVSSGMDSRKGDPAISVANGNAIAQNKEQQNSTENINNVI